MRDVLTSAKPPSRQSAANPQLEKMEEPSPAPGSRFRDQVFHPRLARRRCRAGTLRRRMSPPENAISPPRAQQAQRGYSLFPSTESRARHPKRDIAKTPPTDRQCQRPAPAQLTLLLSSPSRTATRANLRAARSHPSLEAF